MSTESDDESGAGGARERALAVLALVLALCTPALLLFAWSRPRPAPPREVPPLGLAPGAVRAVLARDARLAAEAPEGEEAERRRRLYREANVAEHEAGDTPGQARERIRRLMASLHALVEAHGEDVVARLRAEDVLRAERALAGELPAGDVVSELGGFGRMMERYGMAADGRQTAPRFVVRTTFAARWNSMHGRPLTEGFTEVELQAYWGWLALHAEEAPAELRMSALEHYEAARGERADEARGVLLYGGGDYLAAEDAFRAAYDERGTFRLRNYALAAAERGRGAGEPP